MKTIQLDFQLSDVEADRLKGVLLTSEDYDRAITSTESLRILKPDGSLLIQISKAAIPFKFASDGLAFMRKAKEPITNRGTAAGIQSGAVALAKKTEGGYKTNTDRLPDSVARGLGSSATVGYYDRYSRIPFCRVCRHTEENPALWKKFIPIIGIVNKVFKEGYPERYANQRKLANSTDPAWTIGSSVFTTVTINKNFRTAAHKDAGDFEQGFGVMAYFSTGKTSGGLLVFPKYRIAIELSSCDVVLFDVHEWHGNTELIKTANSERFTCVFYYRQNMIRCGSPDYEVKRSQKCRELGTLYDKEEIEKGDRLIQLAIQNN